MKNLISARKLCSPFGLVLILPLAAMSLSAEATLMTFATSEDATQNGLPVSAQAAFTTSDGHLQIVLKNLIVDPKGVVQNISGISFALSADQTDAMLVSSAGVERNVLSNKTYIDGSSVSTGWVLSTVGSQLRLTMLNTPESPKHTIIGAPAGSGTYARANTSLAGNDPHNPFLNQTASFEIDIPGVDASTQVSSVVFNFNTTEGYDSPGIHITNAPEPATMLLLILGVLTFVKRKF